MRISKIEQLKNYSDAKHIFDSLRGKWFENQTSVIIYFILAKYYWGEKSIYTINPISDQSDKIIEKRLQILKLRVQYYPGTTNQRKWILRAKYICENNKDLINSFLNSNDEFEERDILKFYYLIVSWLFQLKKENIDFEFINNWIDDLQHDLIKYKSDFEIIQNDLTQPSYQANVNNNYFFNETTINKNIFNQVNINKVYHAFNNSNEDVNNIIIESKNENHQNVDRRKVNSNLKKFENYFQGNYAQQNYINLMQWLLKEKFITFDNDSNNYKWVMKQNSNIHVGVLYFFLIKFDILNFNDLYGVEIFEIFNKQFEFPNNKEGSLKKQFQKSTQKAYLNKYSNNFKRIEYSYFKIFEGLNLIFKG